MFLDDLTYIKMNIGIEASEKKEESITWKYVKEVADKNATKTLAKFLDMKFIPKDLNELLLNKSNGRPSKRTLKVNGTEVQVKRVLTLSKEDKGNIFNICAATRDKIQKNMIPFMETENGDLICMSTQGNIHVWFHETNKIVKVAKSLTDFLNKLVD